MYFMKQIILLTGFVVLAFSCRHDKTEETETTTVTQTPVTVTTISTAPLIEYVDLNATATFLQKNYVKANVNGYIKSVHTQIGSYVREGQLLFVLKTKEAQAIGNTINKLSPSFRFSGINSIKAATHGFVNQLDHQVGDYVQDGDQLAVINDMNSFAFVMDLPYELRPYIINKKQVTVTLPDGTKLNGIISAAMPTVDPEAQTQRLIIKVSTARVIPENLIATVRVVKTEHSNTQSLPKAAVLTNDVQSEFWVMKMIDTATAVKVEVKKGIEANDMAEILSPSFSSSDKILLTGNFGLPDTAKVKVLRNR
jgi:multidrug efflux pump subunit AcrA (membrane-fusion protein)